MRGATPREAICMDQMQTSAQPESPSAASPRRSLGAHGEDLAADYLRGCGLSVLARNWRSGRSGELDLVVRDGACIVAVEVKTRSGTGYGSPFDAITLRKAERLRRLLYAWVREARPACDQLRIDAVGITILPGEAPRIEHLRGIA